MKWMSLRNKIDKLPARIIKVEDVCIVDINGKRKPVDVKYDAHGIPYFVFQEPTEFKED